MKIAIAGFQHETNTFAPGQAGKDEFLMADSWPGLLAGNAVIADTRGMNIPIAGAIAAAGQVELVPILWCAAEPCGHVTDEAFEWASSILLKGILDAGALDGIYLDLHGAMVTQSFDDGEGELLRRVRAAVGPDIVIGVSLDLHANISPAMVEAATLMTVFRTYPHLDMADTGARCMRYLIKAINGKTQFVAYRQADFLIPLHAQYTEQSPCKELYHHLDTITTEYGEWAELAMGFTAADVHDCGPSVVVYANSKQRANELTDNIISQLCADKNRLDTKLLSASEGIKRAMQSMSLKPIVIADVQDNPGAGGTSDTTGLLRALIEANARGAVIGVICDSQVAARAHASGPGTCITAELGAKSGLPDQLPVLASFRVNTLSDGQITYTGEMYGGGIATLGASCLLSVDDENLDIKIVVSSIRIQCLDRALFTHFGVELEQTKIICVKSTVHHRADFEPIASEVINVVSPGAFSCEPELADYRKLRPGVMCL